MHATHGSEGGFPKAHLSRYGLNLEGYVVDLGYLHQIFENHHMTAAVISDPI